MSYSKRVNVEPTDVSSKTCSKLKRKTGPPYLLKGRGGRQQKQRQHPEYWKYTQGPKPAKLSNSWFKNIIYTDIYKGQEKER